MSYTFTLRSARSLSFDDVRADLGVPDLAMVEAVASENWPEGIIHLHREFVSARNVEVTKDKGTFEVRLMSMSAPEDTELALRIVETVAARLGVRTVDSENFGELPVSELRVAHDDAWVRNQWESGASVVAAMIGQGRGPITVPGARRSFVLGTRSIAELDTSDKLLARMRRVQWIEREGFRAAGVFEASKDDGRFTFAVLLPDEDIFIPVTDKIVIKDDAAIVFDRSKLADVVGPRWEALDECQGCFRAISGADWNAVIGRARA